MKAFYRLLKTHKSFVIFISLMLVFRSAVADWNDVPTGSMKPTIIEGDRILINKLAYDINIPFIQKSLVKLADPKVNEIIIFESQVSNKRLVKRVIGVPGDIVSLEDNKLIINNKKVNYTAVEQSRENTNNISAQVFTENISAHEHFIQLAGASNQLANFSPVKVPEDHYLVLGDNRNNSADSRVIGFVPRDEIIGRSSKVVLSLNYDNYFLPRSDRFLLDI